MHPVALEEMKRLPVDLVEIPMRQAQTMGMSLHLGEP